MRTSDSTSVMPDMPAAEAAMILSEMMRNRLGVTIGPGALAEFIRNHWSKVSIYAHAIHDGAPK